MSGTRRAQEATRGRPLGHMESIDGRMTPGAKLKHGDVRPIAEKTGDLVIVPDASTVAGFLERVAERATWSTVISATCADNECVHGRLPHDSTDPCGCWPQEREAA